MWSYTLGSIRDHWQPPDDWSHLVLILFSMQTTQPLDVLDDSPDGQVIALLTIAVAGMDGRSELIA